MEPHTSTKNPDLDTGEPNAKAALRSGTAARLAGLSPSTLRIWEHRYGVVSPPRSPSGQRTYSMADVHRLRLIRRLTLEGHAIGTVAGLPLDELVALSEGNMVSSAGEQRILVVGHALAIKLDGRLRPPVARVFDDLAHAESDIAACGAVDVLVVHVASLHLSVTERVLALRVGLPAPTVLVVYSFGAEAAADALRAAGVTVCREPVTGAELARLIAASKQVPQREPEAKRGRSSPRLYSDTELASLAEIPSRVACECPRHLAEIVTLLVGFERYSAECVSAGPTDAALHRHLHDISSVARTMFEQALARVIVDKGLAV
ncbi:MAG: MerR family transcriptional regulator [Ramlibacter sp.]|nr:MerR family transcriptional regulator [Ramlibacter sp.]